MWCRDTIRGRVVQLLAWPAVALVLVLFIHGHVVAQQEPGPKPGEVAPEKPPYERPAPPDEPALQPVEVSPASAIEASARVFEGKGLYREAVSAYKGALEKAIELATDAQGEQALKYWAEAEIYLDRAVSLMYQQPRPEHREMCQFLESLVKEHKLPGVIDALARWKLAAASIRTGQMWKTRRICRQLGFVTNWMVIGPFDNERGQYFNVPSGPESELNFDATYDGKKRRVGWRKLPVEPVLGEVNFDAMMRPNDEVLAYALAFVEVPRETPAALRIGSDEGLKVWVNDCEVLKEDIHRRMGFDQNVVGVMLKPGENKILVKVAERNGDWGFRLRLTAPDGGKLAFKTARTLQDFEDAIYEVTTEMPEVEVARGAIGYYEMRVKETPHDVAAQAHYAYIHLVHRFEDENVYKDKVALEKCIELAPKNPYYHYTLAEAYESRVVRIEAEKEGNKARQYVQKAIELEPEYVEALYHMARYYLTEMKNWRKAQVFLDRALTVNPDYLRALLLELDILSERGFYIEVKLRTLALRKHPKKEIRTSPLLMSRLANIYDGLNRPRETLQIVKLALAKNYGAYWARSRLISHFLNVERLDKALSEYEIMAQIDPYDYSSYIARAGIYEGMDELEKAASEIDRALAVCPEAEDELITKARLLMRLSLQIGEDVKAEFICPEKRAELVKTAPIYAKALAILEYTRTINPNNVWLKRYIEFLTPEKKSYEEHERLAAEVEVKPGDGIYIKSLRAVLDAQGKPVLEGVSPISPKLEEHVAYFSEAELEKEARAANLPYILVLSKQVTDVHKDGTSSEFTHLVIKIFNEEATLQFAQFSAGVFATSWRQEAKIKKALVYHSDGTQAEGRCWGWGIEFPPLAVGDVLDIQFRIDDQLSDLSERFFGDYYGKLHIFQSSIFFARFSGVIAPVKLSEYYLMLPKARKFYFKVLNTEVRPTREPGITDKQEMVIFRLRDLPTIVPEMFMPPPDQFLPCLQVSSFGDWKKFGLWFYNLTKKQYDTSQGIKDKVKELTQDKETELEKIRAIYNFVVTDIRYVAWTYGIHGWQPYKASTIFERKQGDCKDKALLINTMLKEVGITAWPVLIFAATQRGEPNMTLPMVRHFNHCISYVPPSGEREEGFWLDGTAQYYGLTDGPPCMDWGATTLVVDENGGQLQNVPLPDPAQNVQRQEMVVEVLPGGDAKVKVELTVRRDDAAQVRRRFSLTGRRNIELEQVYGRTFSGTKVTKTEFPDLTDLNSETLSYGYELEIPDFLKKTPEGLVLTHDFFQVPWSRLTPQAERKFSYILPYYFIPAPIMGPVPGTLEIDQTFILPQKYSDVTVPENRKFSSEFADFALEFDIEPAAGHGEENRLKVFVKKMLRVKKNNLSIQQYAKLRELTNMIEKSQKEKVVIKEPAAPQPPQEIPRRDKEPAPEEKKGEKTTGEEED